MDRAEALAAAREHPVWYHTIDLAPGVTTHGIADLRRFAGRALPRSLAGARCLDVGTFDGFWAFSMEDRGAAAVVGIDVEGPEDVEHPPLRRQANLAAAERAGVRLGAGFRIAAAARGSSAHRVTCSVYDLDADKVGGPCDFVLVGGILQHLRDPVAALERVRAVLAPGGRAMLVETISIGLTARHPRRPLGEFRAAMPDNNFTWWAPNLSLLRAWATAAGLPPRTRLPVLSRPVRGAGPGDWLAAVPAAPGR